ncbi:tetratricopeptide repeat protein [Methylomicrobium sp. Wu6]|nr:tetratricopeptide repeat protein [Methylomicrobium sp. Wu6]
MQKRFILFVVLPVVLPGCAGLYDQQHPAPVYTGPAPVYRQPPVPPPQPQVQLPEPTVKTTPIPEFNQQLIPIAPAPMTGGTGDSLPSMPDAGAPLAAGVAPTPVTPGAALNVPPPETFTLTPFQPIEPAASSSPAVGALVMAANQNSQSGNLDSAIATIERARNIEPNNAGLYYKLALLRIKQSKPKMAEELAKKAALLAGGDRNLKKHSWLLIAHARELQKDFPGAKAARDKAAGF